MSKSIFEALFYGKVIPWEHRTLITSERKELLEKIEMEKRHLIQKMSLDDCARFEALENLYSQSITTEEVDNFTHGFTLGALLMLEMLENRQQILKD